MDKRCYSTQEAYAYLGLKRRSFEMHIAPLLAGKGTKVGVSVIYERVDLDAAWEEFKSSSQQGKPGTMREKPTATAPSMRSKGSLFAETVARLRLQEKRKR